LGTLKLCVAQRNALIQTLQKHLLIQEVSSRLLLAELDRLDLRVQYLDQLQSRRVIRRCRTYHGRDGYLAHDLLPVSQIKSMSLLTAAKKKRKRNTAAKGMEGQK